MPGPRARPPLNNPEKTARVAAQILGGDAQQDQVSHASRPKNQRPRVLAAGAQKERPGFRHRHRRRPQRAIDLLQRQRTHLALYSNSEGSGAEMIVMPWT